MQIYHDLLLEDVDWVVGIKNTNFYSTSDATQTIQSIITFIVNFILFILILAQPKLQGKRSHQFFLNLQITHILLSIVIIISEFYPPRWKQLYALAVTENAIIMEMTITLLALTADRLIAINYPYWHNYITIKDILLTVVCCWLPPIIFTGLVLSFHIMKHYISAIMTIMIGFAITTLIISNIILLFTAMTRDKSVKRTNRFHKYDERSVVYTKSMFKASYVCFGIVMTFVLCWSPFLVHNILTLTKDYKACNKKYFTIISIQLVLFKSLLDPLLFLVLSIDARNEIWRIFKLHRYDNSSESGLMRLLLLSKSSDIDTATKV